MYIVCMCVCVRRQRIYSNDKTRRWHHRDSLPFARRPSAVSRERTKRGRFRTVVGFLLAFYDGAIGFVESHSPPPSGRDFRRKKTISETRALDTHRGGKNRGRKTPRRWKTRFAIQYTHTYLRKKCISWELRAIDLCVVRALQWQRRTSQFARLMIVDGM